MALRAGVERNKQISGKNSLSRKKTTCTWRSPDLEWENKGTEKKP